MNLRRTAVPCRMLCAGVAVSLAAITSPLRADVFVLSTGGEIRGELLNPDESPRERYEIKAYAGGTLQLAASLVTKVVPQKPIEVAYDHVKLDSDDTVEGQWRLAQWCQDNGLNAQRTRHLERILELDEDHAEVRRLLGYERVGDHWATRDEIMESRGYVKHEGRWRLPQEVKLTENRKAVKEVEQKWYKKIHLWTGWLDRREKEEAAKKYIAAVDSPHAVDALLKKLDGVKKYEHKVVFADALAKVGSGKAMVALARHSIENDNEDFRYYCLDLLERARPPLATALYLTTLKSKDNRHVNRAAIGLARMNDQTTIGPLIDALITQHKYQLGGSPGAMSMTFGNGPNNRGSSFGTGGGPKVVIRNIRNGEVLAALATLTGKDFDFDINAWNAWHASQKPPAPKVNTRRD